MNEYRKEIMRNVYLTVLPARKFKTGCLSSTGIFSWQGRGRNGNTTPQGMNRRWKIFLSIVATP